MSKRATAISRGLITGLVVVLAAACEKAAVVDVPPPPPPPVQPPPPPPPPPVVVLAAGDIADCNTQHDEKTAQIIDGYPNATVLTLGDNAYPSGTAQQFTSCYQPTWGRFKSRTRPAVGNHEYDIPNASGYFGYFGAAAGDPSKGYYSYDIGRFWHFVVLNSNYREGGPAIDASSAQIAWLRADLAASSRMCTLVVFHHPRFTSGEKGNDAGLDAAWREMYAAGVDLVLVGHDHLFERLAPATPSGTRDDQYGVRQFTSGMAGSDAANAYPFGPTLPISEARQNSVTGILRLTLDSATYSWDFLPVAGQSYSDTGTDECHGAPPAGMGNARSAMAVLDPARFDRPRMRSVQLPENTFRAAAAEVARQRATR